MGQPQLENPGPPRHSPTEDCPETFSQNQKPYFNIGPFCQCSICLSSKGVHFKASFHLTPVPAAGRNLRPGRDPTAILLVSSLSLLGFYIFKRITEFRAMGPF